MSALFSAVVAISFYGASLVWAGLNGTSADQHVFGAADVLAGCIYLVVGWLGAKQLWKLS